MITAKLESSPNDKHKAEFGEQNQADYLIMAKGASTDHRSPKKRNPGEKEEIKEESPAKAK